MNSILGRSKGIEPSNDRFTAGCVNRFTTTAIARLIINGIALKSKEKFLRLKELGCPLGKTNLQNVAKMCYYIRVDRR